MAGGTGGHIMPGLALADALRQQGADVHWLGTEQGMEALLVPEHGLTLHTVPIRGVRGKGLLTLFLMPLHLLRAILAAAKVLRRWKPNLVIGFGGYVAAPGGVAAWLSRIPLCIHEQNARAGSTNRMLSRIATRVFSAYPDALPAAEVVGNPVRAEILALPEPEERGLGTRKPLRLLVLGGSQGARVLNKTVPAALALLDADLRPKVRHQAGRTLEDALAAYAAANIAVEPEAFIKNMPAAYAEADLVICRAGALSLAEIMAVGLPAICVPLPSAIDDHQTANARFLVDAGGGWLLPEKDFTPQSLAKLLAEVARVPGALREKALSARAAGPRDAVQRMLSACMELAGGVA